MYDLALVVVHQSLTGELREVTQAELFKAMGLKPDEVHTLALINCSKGAVLLQDGSYRLLPPGYEVTYQESPVGL